MDRLNHLYFEQGQSPWLDNLKRSYLTGGQLTERTLDTNGDNLVTSADALVAVARERRNFFIDGLWLGWCRKTGGSDGTKARLSELSTGSWWRIDCTGPGG